MSGDELFEKGYVCVFNKRIRNIFFSGALQENRKNSRKPEAAMSSISTLRFVLFDDVHLVFEANVQKINHVH